MSTLPSYIGCTSVVRYTDHEIADVTDDNYCASLSLKDMKALFKHVKSSEVLEQRDIDMICDALKAEIIKRQ